MPRPPIYLYCSTAVKTFLFVKTPFTVCKLTWIHTYFEMHFFWVYNQKSKTPSDGTCLGEPLGGFCYVSCIFILFFFICRCSLFTFSFRHHPSPFPHPPHFHFQPSRYLLTASTTVLSGHFLPTGVFYLMILPNIFGTACFYQGFPGSRKLFLEICRASYWSSKHRPTHLFVWFTVIHNLLYILNLYLYMSILQKFYLWWKLW